MIPVYSTIEAELSLEAVRTSLSVNGNQMLDATLSELNSEIGEHGSVTSVYPESVFSNRSGLLYARTRPVGARDAVMIVEYGLRCPGWIGSSDLRKVSPNPIRSIAFSNRALLMKERIVKSMEGADRDRCLRHFDAATQRLLFDHRVLDLSSSSFPNQYFVAHDLGLAFLWFRLIEINAKRVAEVVAVAWRGQKESDCRLSPHCG